MVYPIYQVGVVGGGTMGGGIALVTVRKGLPVILKEANKDLADKTRDVLTKRMEGWQRAGKMTLQALEQCVSLLTVTDNFSDLADVDLVIEAVPENMDLKKSVFRELDSVTGPEVILASNTSSLPIGDISEATGKRDKVVGTHFFNPPTRMNLVEIVKSRYTSSETISAVRDDFLVSTLGKTTIEVTDRPGFLINCLLLPYLGEGILALEESEVSVEDIDTEARDFGWPMGPFTVLDTVGLDTALYVAQFLSQSYPEKIRTGTLFESLVRMNRLGEKNGVGFYSAEGSHEPIQDVLAKLYGARPKVSAKDVFERMMARFLNESVQSFYDGVASRNDIELGCQIGIGCPRGGPLHIVDEMGASALVEQLSGFIKQYGPRFAPSKLLVDMAASGEKFFESW